MRQIRLIFFLFVLLGGFLGRTRARYSSSALNVLVSSPHPPPWPLICSCAWGNEGALYACMCVALFRRRTVSKPVTQKTDTLGEDARGFHKSQGLVHLFPPAQGLQRETREQHAEMRSRSLSLWSQIGVKSRNVPYTFNSRTKHDQGCFTVAGK